MYGKVREDVREIISILCKYKSVEIIAGAVCIDHVHLSVAIPPKLSVSGLYGISEREKQSDALRAVWGFEIQIQEQGVLVQRVTTSIRWVRTRRRYRTT